MIVNPGVTRYYRKSEHLWMVDTPASSATKCLWHQSDSDLGLGFILKWGEVLFLLSSQIDSVTKVKLRQQVLLSRSS